MQNMSHFYFCIEIHFSPHKVVIGISSNIWQKLMNLGKWLHVVFRRDAPDKIALSLKFHESPLLINPRFASSTMLELSMWLQD